MMTCLDEDGITHPLSGKIREWSEIANQSSIKVPFETGPAFAAHVDSLEINDFKKNNIRKTYLASYLLAKSLKGEYDESLHRILYNSSTKEGSFPLCEAARLANNLAHESSNSRDGSTGLKNVMAGFSRSLKLEGITEALDLWSKEFWPKGAVNHTKEMKWWVNQHEGTATEAETYFEQALRELSGEGFESDEVLRKARKSKYERERARKSGETSKGQSSAFNASIKLLWVPAALWCRDSYSIAMILGWDGRGLASEHDRRIGQVDDAVYDLGLTKSRRKHQAVIEKFEASESS